LIELNVVTQAETEVSQRQHPFQSLR